MSRNKELIECKKLLNIQLKIAEKQRVEVESLVINLKVLLAQVKDK